MACPLLPGVDGILHEAAEETVIDHDTVPMPNDADVVGNDDFIGGKEAVPDLQVFELPVPPAMAYRRRFSTVFGSRPPSDREL